MLRPSAKPQTKIRGSYAKNPIIELKLIKYTCFADKCKDLSDEWSYYYIQYMQKKIERTEPRWQRRKDVRPQEIIQAALEYFVQQGYSATKVDQVAQRAGVTPGTLYVYFENKEALLKAVVHESIGPVFQYADQQLEGYSGTASDLLRTFIREWRERIASGPFSGIPKLIVAEAQNYPDLAKFYIKEVQERGRDFIKHILRYGIQRGEFAVRDLDITARIIMAPLQYASIMPTA
jgi:TetR/AcrR family transcriptional regulator